MLLIPHNAERKSGKWQGKPEEHEERIWENSHPFSRNSKNTNKQTKQKRENGKEEIIKIIIEKRAPIKSSGEKPQIKKKSKHNTRLVLVKFQNPNNNETILEHFRERRLLNTIRKINTEFICK